MNGGYCGKDVGGGRNVNVTVIVAEGVERSIFNVQRSTTSERVKINHRRAPTVALP